MNIVVSHRGPESTSETNQLVSLFAQFTIRSLGISTVISAKVQKCCKGSVWIQSE